MVQLQWTRALVLPTTFCLCKFRAIEYMDPAMDIFEVGQKKMAWHKVENPECRGSLSRILGLSLIRTLGPSIHYDDGKLYWSEFLLIFCTSTHIQPRTCIRFGSRDLH